MSEDKIAEIRARHEAGPIGHLPIAAFSLADDDRSFLLAEVERLREEMQSAKADAWEDGYEAHRQMIEGIARKPSNPYR